MPGLRPPGCSVIRVPGSELGSLRGGPRCMACAVGRDPVAASGGAAAWPAEAERVVVELTVPGSREASQPGAGQVLMPVPAGSAAAAAAGAGRVRVTAAQVTAAGLTAGQVTATQVPVAPVTATQVPVAPVTATQVPVAPVTATQVPAASEAAARPPAPGAEVVSGPAASTPSSAAHSNGGGWRRRHSAKRGVQTGRLGAGPGQPPPALAAAPAALPAAARAAARSAANPERAEQQAYPGDNDHETGDPRQCPDDGQRHQDDEDRGYDNQQHAEHHSTLRRNRRVALAGTRRMSARRSARRHRAEKELCS